MFHSKASFNLRHASNSVRTVNSFLSTCLNNLQKGEVKPFNEIPGPAPSLPLFGTSWQYYVGRYNLFKFHEANIDKYHRYGPIVKEEFEGRKPVVLVFEPKDFETVFRSQGKYPIRPPNEFVCHFRKHNPDKYPTVGISNLQGEEWLAERKPLSSAFSKHIIDKCFPPQNKIAEDFVDYLWKIRDANNVVNNVQEETYLLSIEALSMLCFNSRLNCFSQKASIDGKQLIAATKKLFESYQELYYGLPVWKIAPKFSKAYQKYVRAEEAIYNLTSKYIVNAMEKGNGESVLELLLSSKKLSEKEVRTTIIDFLAGGTTTTSTTMAYTLQNLANNFTAQKRLQEELDSSLSDSESLTLDKLNSFSYLKACVKEVFRLSSTIPSIVRILPEDVVLSGYRVPAGTPIFCCSYVTSRVSKFFEEPLKFKPERWFRHSRTHNPYSSLPFGFGTRQCIGRWFSELLLHTATANILRKYKLESVTADVESIHSFILVPESPIKIKITPRK
ncbi:cytochrome P450-like protein [Dinothrombium tinctorium]|uniref:Cytochrome P450-like protein n=1 Tax=Dinothrombium tinctorium TaxID=1965070 RepID=A0A3S3Q475_9ACAR|nr:cytochrome P450-like protein [Dinothrombium tinctorium]